MKNSKSNTKFSVATIFFCILVITYQPSFVAYRPAGRLGVMGHGELPAGLMDRKEVIASWANNDFPQVII